MYHSDTQYFTVEVHRHFLKRIRSKQFERFCDSKMLIYGQECYFSGINKAHLHILLERLLWKLCHACKVDFVKIFLECLLCDGSKNGGELPQSFRATKWIA